VLGKQGDTFTWGKAEPNEDWQYEITVIPRGDVDYEKYETLWNENKATNSNSGTVIFINSLKEEFTDVDAAHLQMFVSRTYAINFKQKAIGVKLNGSLVPYVKLFGTPHSPEFAKKQMTFGDISFAVSIFVRDKKVSTLDSPLLEITGLSSADLVWVSLVFLSQPWQSIRLFYGAMTN
jgi:hypothetical protein